jgi:large subunit ribosomal protein L25
MSASKQIPQINVQRRDQLGSRYAARLRKTGKLPAVIYGHKQDPVHVSVDYKEIHAHLHNNAHLLNATLDSATESVLIRDVQWDHLGSTLVHIDLARVDLNERVTVDVPLHFTGDAPGLKEVGAILEHPVTEIEIETLVTEIPDEILVDVSGLNVGDSISVAELKLPANVTTTADPETIVVSVSVVQEQAETEVDADAPTEPKVIGKEPEADAEAAAPEAKKK